MLAVSALGAAFVVAVTAASIGVIAWLLSAGGIAVRTAPVRASATLGSDDGASGSDRPVPTHGARLEPPGP